jgi:hypothetical protein
MQSRRAALVFKRRDTLAQVAIYRMRQNFSINFV